MREILFGGEMFEKCGPLWQPIVFCYNFCLREFLNVVASGYNILWLPRTLASKVLFFSKAVQDFRTNGVAILPLRMEEGVVERSRELCMAAWEEAPRWASARERSSVRWAWANWA